MINHSEMVMVTNKEIPEEYRCHIVPASGIRQSRHLNNNKCPAIIEQTQHEEGMQSLAERKDKQDVVWYTTLAIDSNSEHN